MPRHKGRKRSISEREAEETENRSQGQLEQQRVLPLPKARQPLPLHFSKVHRLGQCSKICQQCEAQHWIEERMSRTSIANPDFSLCCAKGKVSLPDPVCPPDELRNLLVDQTQGRLLFGDLVG